MRTSNLSLETLAAGAAQEMFEDALKEVAANIHDINCDAKKADGGAWQAQARTNIAAWLRGKTSVPVIA